MRLVSATFENYKSVRSRVSLDSLRTANTLVGPNNEGKSTLLEALHMIRTLHVPLEGDPKGFMLERLPGKSLNNRVRIQLEFELESEDIVSLGKDESSETLQGIDRVSYIVAWGGQVGGPSGIFCPTDIEVKLQTGQNLSILKLSGDGHVERRESNLAEILREGETGPTSTVTTSDVAKRAILRFFHIADQDGLLRFLGSWAGSLFYVPSHRRINVIGPTDIGPIEDALTNLDGASLPGYLHKLRSNEGQRYERFEGIVARLIPSVKKVYTHAEESGDISIRVYHDVARTEDAHRLDTVGGGVGEAIYLAAMIWLSPPGSTILVEEPERGLHAATQRLIFNEALAHAQQEDKQLFFATHSTVFAPLTDNCSVHLVARVDQEDTTVTDVGKEQGGLISEALGHSNVDLYNYDVVLAVDGETEVEALPDLVRCLVGEEAFRAIHMEPLKGDLASKYEVVAHLIRLLAASRTQLFVFADDDEGARKAVVDLEREFKNTKAFTADQVHLWARGIRGRGADGRGAEFEDNFSYQELVCAANELGEGEEMVEEELKTLAESAPEKAISKVLERYYHDAGYQGWSKPKLGRLLGAYALAKIQSDNPRGHDEVAYEFEEAINKVKALIRGSPRRA
ncbi:MAG: ATP-binding protein [Chloroflexi bacterium]|nr:ATP-binding protein [Chloroflexota bacterium]